jgi:hypothetical protein
VCLYLNNVIISNYVASGIPVSMSCMQEMENNKELGALQHSQCNLCRQRKAFSQKDLLHTSHRYCENFISV